LNVSVRGELYPRGEARVNVTARGTGVDNATVSLGDRVLGHTADDGTTTGQFPQTTGNVTVTAAKGMADGTQTLALKRLTVTASPAQVVAFPWTGVRIRGELGNESVEGVAIRINGRPVGETNTNGALNATLPPAYGVTVTAIGYGQRASTTAGNPLLLLLATVVASLVIVGVGVRRGRRSGRTVRGAVASIVGVGVRMSQRLFGGMVALASRIDDLVRLTTRLIRRLRDDITAIPQLLGRWARRVHRRLTACIAWIRRLSRRGMRLVTALTQGVYTVVRNPKQLLLLLVGWIQRKFGSDDTAAPGGTDDDPTAAGKRGVGDENEEESRLTVREAWREFLEYVSVRRWQTKTPGQISRRAVESDGLPPDAVELLTNSFRDVEYGNQSAKDKVAGAREALERIERKTHGESEDEGR
jgi:hypothetical protein